jgi:hypothetical protein
MSLEMEVICYIFLTIVVCILYQFLRSLETTNEITDDEIIEEVRRQVLEQRRRRQERRQRGEEREFELELMYYWNAIRGVRFERSIENWHGD